MQQLHPETESPRRGTSAAELVLEAMSEARHLIQLEVALAKDEVKREIGATKNAGIALGAGAICLVLALTLFLVAVALAIFPGPVPALVMGLVLLATGVLAGLTGMKLLPKKPLANTRKRIEMDIETVKEHVV